MFKTKKGVELTFNTLIIAVICLVVLIVIIAIFTGQIGDISQGFTKLRERETDETVLDDLFGCEEGSTICRNKAEYECTGGEFVKKRDCPNECEGDSCA